MNAKTQIKIMVVAVASAFGAPSYAIDGAVFSGEVTPKLYSFDYFKGSGTDATQFLERYNYQQGMGGDQRDGSYLDLDVNIIGKNAQRNVFELERVGFGAHNHRGTVKANSDTLGFKGYYSNFRTSTGGLAFRYMTGQVPGYPEPNAALQALYSDVGGQSSYVGQFNNDSPGQTSYKVDRTTYGLGLALKPTLFGNSVAAALDYDGYKRDGNRLATWVAGGSDFTNNSTAAFNRQRWRGFDMPVDEKLNRYTLSLNGAPGGFNIAYEGSVEKFDNKARNYTFGDFNAIVPGGVGATKQIKPLHFVPDSTLISNNLRFAKNYGGTAVAAGYGLSVLDQDSFSAQQQSVGYTTGKITTNSAYLNLTSNAVSGIGLEGFVKYNNRKNGSSFPVAGLITPTTTEALGVRINRIKTLNYGLSGMFRVAAMKSTVTVGWKREDKDRDLTWAAVSLAPAVNGIQPQMSFYREKTRSDELYANWIARPMPGVTLRVSPAYVWAGETGQVTEPEKAFVLKAKLTHAAKNGMLTSGYYNYRNQKNANNSIIAATANNEIPPAGAATTQDLDRTQQAAGLSLNLPVSEWINTSASLSWMQDDFASYYLRSGRRRYEAPKDQVTFITNDRPTYKIDTYVLTLGGDWQVNDDLRYNGSYTWSQSKGNTASGDIYTALSAANNIDGTINSAVHSLALGVDYVVKKNVKLKASYVYEYNKDASYTDLTGGYHTLMLGVGFGF
ncbi:MAG: MtrB/PioB family outer membrane beta-barrel protein [Sulfuritalea sp.]|nr:MtrB/PioB family outer membrane beta-barrel protein [Sulfuritalea sp.]MDP1983258.1 MtrB/PioB family outer membrane beta-barrel protein [Sulfuritalea sp.]